MVSATVRQRELGKRAVGVGRGDGITVLGCESIYFSNNCLGNYRHDTGSPPKVQEHLTNTPHNTYPETLYFAGMAAGRASVWMGSRCSFDHATHSNMYM